MIYLIVTTVIICSAYLVFRMLQLNHKLHTTTQELESLRISEQQLREQAQEKENKLQHVMEDPVTGLPIWSVFEEKLAHAVKESERYQYSFGVLFIDIDDFKMINDGLSYQAGDELLKEVGVRLKSCIRQVDSISRFTKDTFVVLLGQLAKPETAALVAQRMLQVLAESFQISGNELYVTAGIGITLCPADANDAASLLRNADHALHLAKEKGKHVHQFYQERMYEKSQRELALNTSLNQEFIYQEFIIYYQPITDKHSNAVVCMDALLHWQHPELGLIKSHELADLFEKQRKSNVMTEWLIENACRQFMQWKESGLNVELVGIPVCIKQLEHSHFIYRISQILQDLKFNPANLLLELTDGTPQISFDILEKAFNMLKYLGVKIAIEDFGTNAFSLRYLKTLSVDYVKINHALIDDVASNQQTRALIKSVLFLGQSMNMQVIVQGVESEAQVNTLKEIGCALMQGQFIGAPLTESEVKA